MEYVLFINETNAGNKHYRKVVYLQEKIRKGSMIPRKIDT